MINKKISTMFLVISLAFFSFEAWAGPLVWGPKKYIRATGPPAPITDTFTIEKPKGKFWLQVGNGGHVKRPDLKRGAVEPVNQASSAYIKLNGVQVVGPNDLNQNVYGVDKDIALQENNTIEVEVRGNPESYITVEIRKAELNTGVDNAKGDLSGENMKDQIGLWWSGEENASEYVVYRSYSKDGPWIEWFRSFKGEPVNAVDGTPEEAQTMDLCYKIEALDSRGKVIRRYEPICVPKWQTEESALPLTIGELSNTGIEPASAGLTQTPSASYNDMCLSDDDFTNTSTMSYEDIKKFLKDKGSFLKEDLVKDVDGIFIRPADFIDFAADTYGINPQVILTTLQKEQRAIRAQTRLDDWKLKRIMGYSKPSNIVAQIVDAAAQMRRDFNRLSIGQPTAGGWQVGVAKLSGEPNPGDEKDASGKSISVTPANKAVAVLFSYTPWVGKDWGGGISVREPRRTRIGGNASFCQVWKDFGFFKPVGCGTSKIGYTTQQMSINQTQTLTVTNPEPGVTYTWNVASGGGSISPTIGTSVTYTAPASNPNCNFNPVIEMGTGGVVCDILKIIVNAAPTEGTAYATAVLSGSGCTWSIYKHFYDCYGAEISAPSACDGCDCSSIDCMGCACGFVYCEGCGCWGNWNPDPNGFFCKSDSLIARCTSGGRCGSFNGIPIACEGTTDIRTEAQKAAGCCPAALLRK